MLPRPHQPQAYGEPALVLSSEMVSTEKPPPTRHPNRCIFTHRARWRLIRHGISANDKTQFAGDFDGTA